MDLLGHRVYNVTSGRLFRFGTYENIACQDYRSPYALSFEPLQQATWKITARSS